MYTRSIATTVALASLAAAAPAPAPPAPSYGSWGSKATAAGSFAAADQSGNVAGYTNAAAPYASMKPTPLTVVPSSFGPDSQVSAIHTTAPISGPGAAAPQRSEFVNGKSILLRNILERF